MDLTFLERIALLQILPREGAYLTLKIIRVLREDLSFSEDEHTELKFREEGGRMHWDPAVSATKDVAVGEKALDVIVGALKKMDKEGKLTQDYMDLYERFVTSKDD